MEAEIGRIMRLVENEGGMYKAVESGLVQTMIGESARRFQAKVESGDQTVVGVNRYQVAEDALARQPLARPDPAGMRAHVASFKAWKAARSGEAVAKALDALGAAAQDRRQNVFEQVVAAAEAGCTHGEICGRLRHELGFGHVQALV
jgi:methylmalonyl-CoA mutase N-terminal domain/subunit